MLSTLAHRVLGIIAGMSDRPELGPRKSAVLRAVVEEFVRSGEPVGSETVAERSALGVSPATIRNVMSDLEEMGLIANTNGARISNNSWGYGVNEYDLSAASFDAAVRDSLPLVEGAQQVSYVFAAGVNGGGEQVIGFFHGVEITGKMQVDIFHRHDLRMPTTSGATQMPNTASTSPRKCSARAPTLSCARPRCRWRSSSTCAQCRNL